MFRSSELWYHGNMLDCALEVMGIKYNHPEYIMVRAHLVNRDSGIYYETDTYKIYRKDFWLWVRGN